MTIYTKLFTPSSRRTEMNDPQSRPGPSHVVSRFLVGSVISFCLSRISLQGNGSLPVSDQNEWGPIVWMVIFLALQQRDLRLSESLSFRYA